MSALDKGRERFHGTAFAQITLREIAEGGLQRVLFAEVRQHVGDVFGEDGVRRKDNDIAGVESRVFVEKVRDPMEGDGGFAAASHTLHDQEAIFDVSNDAVLLVLNRGDDVLHLFGRRLREDFLEIIVRNAQVGIETARHGAIDDLELAALQDRAVDASHGRLVKGGAETEIVKHARDWRAPIIDVKAAALFDLHQPDVKAFGIAKFIFEFEAAEKRISPRLRQLCEESMLRLDAAHFLGRGLSVLRFLGEVHFAPAFPQIFFELGRLAQAFLRDNSSECAEPFDYGQYAGEIIHLGLKLFLGHLHRISFACSMLRGAFGLLVVRWLFNHGVDAFHGHGLHRAGLALDFLFKLVEELPLLHDDAVQLLDVMFEVREVRFQFFDSIRCCVAHRDILQRAIVWIQGFQLAGAVLEGLRADGFRKDPKKSGKGEKCRKIFYIFSGQLSFQAITF